MSEFQELYMFDVASQSGDSLANRGALVGLSDSVDFGRFTWDDSEGPETSLAEFRPTMGNVTHGALSSRDANREAPPQVAPTRATAVGKSAGNSLPLSEVLLQIALSVMQSLTSALQNTLQAPMQTVWPYVKVDIPTYAGYHDCKSANEYLDRLLHYQQATGLSDAELLERVVPESLMEQATRWFRLIGHRTRTVEEFRDSFHGEFLPANSKWCLGRELELRTQHPNELYRLANSHVTNAEKVERVTRQAHPTFASTFGDLSSQT